MEDRWANVCVNVINNIRGPKQFPVVLLIANYSSYVLNLVLAMATLASSNKWSNALFIYAPNHLDIANILFRVYRVNKLDRSVLQGSFIARMNFD